MKNLLCLGLLFVASILCGCRTESKATFEGNRAVTQTTHVAEIYPFVRSPYFCFHAAWPKVKPVTLESMHGTYKYGTNSESSLKLDSLKGNAALLIPEADLSKKGLMKNGNYVFNIYYNLGGQDYSCRFNVKLVTKTHLDSPIWDWLKFVSYMRNAAPGD